MENNQNPIINVVNLTKKFGDFTAVDSISFSVSKGEMFAFLGPNGAGKSTTIKMLTTLLTPTGGQILLNGFNPVTQQDETRKSFGIVFQDPSLDDELTAFENINFHGILYRIPGEIRKTRIDELLHLVDLWDKRNHLVKTFSGGMKRRLEIARALLHHPTIFFLDEPTIGLDPQTRNQLWQYIQVLNKTENVTVFFTTHYMEEAEKIARRIAVIDHGKIIASGSADDLRRQTQTNSLEEAFLNLTGRQIRDEEGTVTDQMRLRHRMWTNNRK
jgi:ABC-2 type transport system ATP-binding protein